MKKIIVCLALVLSTFAVCAAQEMNVTVYSRLDANKPWPLESTTLSNNRINWGNSSLYVMTDGSIADKLTFDVSLNFLNSDPESLYRNQWRCDNLSWVNWADLTFAINDKWSLSAGKQIMLAGGWELDPYDHEQHLDLCSMDWQNINVYQWGSTVKFAPSEDHSYAFQITTSPLRDYFWEGTAFAANFQTCHTFGNYSGIYSANYIKNTFMDDADIAMITLGNQYSNDLLTAYIDLKEKTPCNSDFGALNTTITGSVTGNFLDGALEVGLKGGYETISSRCPDFFGYAEEWAIDEDGISGIVPLGITSDKDYAFGGLFVHYYPFEDLRVHAAVATNNYTKGVSATIGILYSFGFKVF